MCSMLIGPNGKNKSIETKISEILVYEARPFLTRTERGITTIQTHSLEESLDAMDPLSNNDKQDENSSKPKHLASY